MKKLLFLINSLQTGGAERVLTDLVRMLPKDRYAITVATLTGGRFSEDLPAHVTCRRLVPAWMPGIAAKLLSKLPRLTGLLLGHGYDTEIAYLEGFPTKVIAHRRTGAKKIAFVHIDVAVRNYISPLYKTNGDCVAQ